MHGVVGDDSEERLQGASPTHPPPLTHLLARTKSQLTPLKPRCSRILVASGASKPSLSPGSRFNRCRTKLLMPSVACLEAVMPGERSLPPESKTCSSNTSLKLGKRFCASSKMGCLEVPDPPTFLALVIAACESEMDDAIEAISSACASASFAFILGFCVVTGLLRVMLKLWRAVILPSGICLIQR